MKTLTKKQNYISKYKKINLNTQKTHSTSTLKKQIDKNTKVSNWLNQIEKWNNDYNLIPKNTTQIDTHITQTNSIKIPGNKKHYFSRSENNDYLNIKKYGYNFRAISRLYKTIPTKKNSTIRPYVHFYKARRNVATHTIKPKQLANEIKIAITDLQRRENITIYMPTLLFVKQNINHAGHWVLLEINLTKIKNYQNNQDTRYNVDYMFINPTSNSTKVHPNLKSCIEKALEIAVKPEKINNIVCRMPVLQPKIDRNSCGAIMLEILKNRIADIPVKNINKGSSYTLRKIQQIRMNHKEWYKKSTLQGRQ